jgi:membrane protease YdiL (CAAX protease family)
LPVVLTLIIYPLTSRPFTGQSAAIWLIVPVREEMIFSGYIYGLLDATFPETVTSRIPVRRAVLLTAVFFSLWHTPNLLHMAPAYVLFQLLYTLLGGAWMLLARQWTGSILPGVATHMAVNFIAWKGW